MKEGKLSDLDQALIQLNANISMPSRQASMKDPDTGISTSTKLTSEEYNEVLRIANDKLGLEDQVKSVIQMIKEDNNKNDLIVYQNHVNKTFSDVFEISKKLLIEESIYGNEIKQRIADKAQKLKEFGKGAK
jgi:galactitol-specific phosphotransferase system IIB component